MYNYIKALHIIFVVTWFAGLFYIVRLFIYDREAEDKPENERKLFHEQFGIMIRRLWYGITWPSCILTLIFGSWMLYLYGSLPVWLIIKLFMVAALVGYHFSLNHIFKLQARGIYKYTSHQLRMWNEVATVLLFGIVFLVVLKSAINWLWALAGLALLTVALFSAIHILKRLSKTKK